MIYIDRTPLDCPRNLIPFNESTIDNYYDLSFLKYFRLFYSNYHDQQNKTVD